MKAHDIIKLLSTRIDNQGLIDLTQEPDKELSQEEANDLKEKINSLMTFEAAKNNPKIVESIKTELFPVHKKTVLKDFEDKLKPLADKLGVDISDKKFADEMFSTISEAISEKAEKGFQGDKSVVEALKKEREQLAKQLEDTKQEYEGKLTNFQKEQKQKELFREFENKFNNYNLADSYKDDLIKSSLKKSLWEEVTSKAHLDLSDNGIKVFEKEMPEKELYINNKPATLESLLEPKISNYLKKADEPIRKPSAPENSKPVYKNSYQERYARKVMNN